MDSQDNLENAKERCFQEQTWLTGTSLAFTGFLGGVQSALTCFQAIVSIGSIVSVSCFAALLVIDRACRYYELDKKIEGNTKLATEIKNWRLASQIKFVFQEKSGSLFCVVILVISALTATLLLWSKRVI